MTQSKSSYLEWFPYRLREYQDRAVRIAADVFSEKTVGMLSADCGVGKTMAVLSGYLFARNEDPESRLFILTRTHSQSRVFEEEIEVLRRENFRDTDLLTVTSMVSRAHVCPIRGKLEGESNKSFIRSCAAMIKNGRCTHYWNFYSKKREEGRVTPTEEAMSIIDNLMEDGIITRDVVTALASEEMVCPYEVLRWCARRSRVIIGPYSYLMRERVKRALLSSLNQRLDEADILVDEAHNLPSNALDSETSILSGENIVWLRDNKNSIVKATEIEWLGEAIEFLWNTLLLHSDKITTSRDELVLESWDVVPRFIDEITLHLLLSRTSLTEVEESVPTETPLDRLADFLYQGLKTRDSTDWHITLGMKWKWKETPEITDMEFKIRPLNAAGIIAPVLRTARSALLMSGTLRPTDLYANLMGVRGCLAEDIASPFPRQSRMVLLDQELSTKYTERGPDLWRKIAERIGQALQAMPAEKSALIAFSSYDIMEQVLSYNIDTSYRHRVIENRDAKIEDLVEQVNREPCAVFLVYGGKFSEGVDLVKDGHSMIDLVIGVGIPFSPPNSYQSALQDWYEKKFGKGAGYHYSSVVPSIRKVVQLAGRLRRSPEDSGVVLLLDKRFKRHIRMFGADIEGDLWPYRNVNEMSEAIRMFTKSRQERGNENEERAECLGC